MTCLDRARAAAALCGVTRLADITGLDSIGLPVFQAIRPWSRALSVHQGKGLTPLAAKMGALMEAVESHNAEMFEAERLDRSFNALPPGERAPSPADFAADRDDAPDGDEALSWVAARRLTTGGTIWIPFDVVSLDFTRVGDRRLDRSSIGLGARFDAGGAMLTAILEVVERDADRAWRATSVQERSMRRVDAGSIPYPWFRSLGDRIAGQGLSLTLYHLPAVIEVAVFMCEIADPAAGKASRRIAGGSAAHPSAEEALLKAVAEAAQSRLTAISGARDDIFHPNDQGRRPLGIGLGLPLPPGIRSRTWDEIAGLFDPAGDVTAGECAARLARAGYPDAAVIDVSPPHFAARVVKAVVPGLGAFGRTRRPPEQPA
ncbi:MAG: YcaO-like family protein [Caulobacteraceae bacterium]